MSYRMLFITFVRQIFLTPQISGQKLIRVITQLFIAMLNNIWYFLRPRQRPD